MSSMMENKVLNHEHSMEVDGDGDNMSENEMEHEEDFQKSISNIAGWKMEEVSPKSNQKRMVATTGKREKIRGGQHEEFFKKTLVRKFLWKVWMIC
jgi:hypothetical protein